MEGKVLIAILLFARSPGSPGSVQTCLKVPRHVLGPSRTARSQLQAEPPSVEAAATPGAEARPSTAPARSVRVHVLSALSRYTVFALSNLPIPGYVFPQEKFF